MDRPIFQYLEDDHRRLDQLLVNACAVDGKIDTERYHRFRTGLLRHIKMEEKILFPAARKAANGKFIPLADKLRLDHGAITALLVLPPDKDVVKVLSYILEQHDQLEEQAGGMYDICKNLTRKNIKEVLTQLHLTPEVPVNPFNSSEYAFDATKRALSRAGYDYNEILKSI